MHFRSIMVKGRCVCFFLSFCFLSVYLSLSFSEIEGHTIASLAAELVSAAPMSTSWFPIVRENKKNQKKDEQRHDSTLRSSKKSNGDARPLAEAKQQACEPPTTHFPSPWKGRFESKALLFSTWRDKENSGFRTRNPLCKDEGKWLFWPRNPLSQELSIQTSVGRWRTCNNKQAKCGRPQILPEGLFRRLPILSATDKKDGLHHSDSSIGAAMPEWNMSHSQMTLTIWAAAEIITKIQPSRFSGVHLVFEVFQDIWQSNKKNPSVSWAALPCPLMASKYANWYLVLISFRSLWSWPFLELFGLVVSYLALQACISCYSVSDISGAFCLCLVHIKMPLLICVASLSWGTRGRGHCSSPPQEQHFQRTRTMYVGRYCWDSLTVARAIRSH